MTQTFNRGDKGKAKMGEKEQYHGTNEAVAPILTPPAHRKWIFEAPLIVLATEFALDSTGPMRRALLVVPRAAGVNHTVRNHPADNPLA